MSVFQNFLNKHGQPQNCKAVDQSNLEKYENILPQSLLNHWKLTGWCSYAEEFLWIVNPDDYESVLEEWLGERAKNMTVFARTGFGDLMIWASDGVYELYVHHGYLLYFIDDLDDYINISLTLDSYLDKTLARPFFQQVKEKLGSLNNDEMYGFEPALVVGGSGDINSVVKVRIFEHLSILSQFSGVK